MCTDTSRVGMAIRTGGSLLTSPNIYELTGLNVKQLAIADEQDLLGLFQDKKISFCNRIFIKSAIHEFKTRHRSRSLPPTPCTREQNEARRRLRRAAERQRERKVSTPVGFVLDLGDPISKYAPKSLEHGTCWLGPVDALVVCIHFFCIQQVFRELCWSI